MSEKPDPASIPVRRADGLERSAHQPVPLGHASSRPLSISVGRPCRLVRFPSKIEPVLYHSAVVFHRHEPRPHSRQTEDPTSFRGENYQLRSLQLTRRRTRRTKGSPG